MILLRPLETQTSILWSDGIPRLKDGNLEIGYPKKVKKSKGCSDSKKK